MELQAKPKGWSSFEVEQLVGEKLTKANIIFVDEVNINKDSPIDDIVRSIMELTQKEFLRRHKHTARLFYHFCYPVTLGFVREVGKDLCLESGDYITTVTILGGYCKGMEVVHLESTDHPDAEVFYKTIPTLFSKEEFAGIIQITTELLVQLPEKLIKAHIWLKEDVKPKKKQMDAVMEFVEILEKGIPKQDDSKVKEIAQKVLDSGIMEPGAHSLLWNQNRKKVGLLSPSDQVLSDLEKIFIYLDILFYAGFSVDPTLGIEKMKFVRWGDWK